MAVVYAGFEEDVSQPPGAARPNGDAMAAETDPAKIPLTTAAWMARDLPPPDYLMGELFSTTARIQLSADTGLGKSMFGLAVAVAMALAVNFLHWKARRKARVLVIDGEMPPDLLQDRIRVACSWFGVDPASPIPGCPGHAAARRRGRARVAVQVHRQIGGVDFVVFDNCMALTVGDLREETTGARWCLGRGSRYWRVVTDKAADVSLKLTWKKSRRRTAANRADFATVTIKLADGVWSAKTEEGGGPINGAPKRLTAAGTIALNALQKALTANGERPPPHEMLADVKVTVTLKQWRAYFSQVAGYSTDAKSVEAERVAFRRGRESVLATGRGKVWSEFVWMP